MKTLAIILARAGSKGLPGKNTAALHGRALIDYTIDHALAARRLAHIVVSSDDPMVLQIARRRHIDTLDRPFEFAHDTATVDAAARNVVETLESRDRERYEAVVILYGNIPLRPYNLIDRAIDKLKQTQCDSVQSVYPVGKTHPLWMRSLTGDQNDILENYQPNNIYRRQDLPPVYMLNGGIIAVTRQALDLVSDTDPHAFLGRDRRAIVTDESEVIDIDTPADFTRAAAIMDIRRRPCTTSPAGFPPVNIAGRLIDKTQPAYVIAELGVNHDGKLGRAVELVQSAKDAGANAIKLQLFNPDLLLSNQAELAAYQEAGETDPKIMLRRLQLPLQDMITVRDVARRLDLGFIVTCFSLELAHEMMVLDPDAVKIASPDAVNLPLIDALVSLKKPMLISTGTCRLEELSPTLLRLSDVPVALFHCVSAYPVPPEQANLNRIPALAGMFNRTVGYSDHTTMEHAGMIAASLGASIIEKHLTYSRAAAGPDHVASFDPEQFAQYVRLIRSVEQMQTGDPYGIQTAEADVRRVSRQSVCAVCDLSAGRTLQESDLTVKRPGTGIPAANLKVVVGKTLKNDVAANNLLTEDDIDESISDPESPVPSEKQNTTAA